MYTQTLTFPHWYVAVYCCRLVLIQYMLLLLLLLFQLLLLLVLLLLLLTYTKIAHTKMLRVVKNVTWRQRITNEMLYAGLPTILTTIRLSHLRFSGHCWRSKNEVVSSLVLWKLKHGNRSIGRQTRTFVCLLEADTVVPRDCLLAVIDDRVGWRKKATGGSTEVDLVVEVVV